MDKIKLSDIDLNILKKCKLQGTQSTIYGYGDLCIKIFNEMYPEENKSLYKKFLEMDGLVIEEALLPKSLIIQNDILVGYIMENFANSICLSDYYSYSRYLNCEEMFKTIKKASLILRKFHNNNIVLNDLSLENILIDKNGNIKYCDMDSCKYKNYTAPYISLVLKRFMCDYRKEKRCQTSENTDKISFMLSFFLITYLNEIQKISKKKYYELANHLNTLSNSEPYAKMLLDKKSAILEIPYMDELIDENDNYIIDREKQLSLKQKILRIF